RLITIPARHHGSPLPVPRRVQEPLMAVGTGGVAHRGLPQPHADPRSGRAGDPGIPLGRATVEAVRRCLLEGPTIAFVPTVALASPVALALARALEGAGVEATADYVHSRDPRRDQKIEAFREGRTRLLVSTTVLERGITVPGAQVVVLFASDDRVYDARNLVQMAGRVGRSAQRPGGLVYFIGHRRTPAVARAIAQIRSMNRWAAR